MRLRPTSFTSSPDVPFLRTRPFATRCPTRPSDNTLLAHVGRVEEVRLTGSAIPPPQSPSRPIDLRNCSVRGQASAFADARKAAAATSQEHRTRTPDADLAGQECHYRPARDGTTCAIVPAQRPRNVI